jgi:hypothetical protein
MRERDSAVDGLVRGEARRAGAQFALVAAQDPRDLGAEAFAQVSDEVANALSRRAAEATRVETVELSSLHAALATPAPEVPNTARTTDQELRAVSTQANLVIDDDRWFQQHALAAPLLDPAVAPEHVLAYFRKQPLKAAYVHADHVVSRYGDATLVVTAPQREPRAFLLRYGDDQSALLEPTFAQLVGGTLLVQLAYNGYASAVRGHTGYLAAYDATSGAQRWLSQARVANATSFVVTADRVVTGYGFTSEPDYVYVLDLATGSVRQRLPLKSAPSYVIAKDAQLYVRTGGMDYVLAFPSGSAAAAPAQLAPKVASVASADTSGATREARAACWLKAALAAVDARNASTLAQSTHWFASSGFEPAIGSALARIGAWMERRAGGDAVIDLWARAPKPLPAPPFARMAPKPRPKLNAPRPKLVKLSSEDADPVRSVGTAPYSPDAPYFLAPVENGVLPEGAPADIPSFYGRESLRAIIPSGEHTLLIYGGRYLVVLRGKTTEHILDLDAFRHPPKPNPQWAQFAVQDATYAQVRGNTLYVCNGGGSYARDVRGKKGFVTAINLVAAQTLWRSDPLVCNSTFAVTGEHLVTGYGFTDEPDFLYVLSAADGVSLAKAPLQSGPDTVTLNAGTLRVEAYAHRYAFELR